MAKKRKPRKQRISPRSKIGSLANKILNDSILDVFNLILLKKNCQFNYQALLSILTPVLEKENIEVLKEAFETLYYDHDGDDPIQIYFHNKFVDSQKQFSKETARRFDELEAEVMKDPRKWLSIISIKFKSESERNLFYEYQSHKSGLKFQAEVDHLKDLFFSEKPSSLSEKWALTKTKHYSKKSNVMELFEDFEERRHLSEHDLIDIGCFWPLAFTYLGNSADWKRFFPILKECKNPHCSAIFLAISSDPRKQYHSDSCKAEHHKYLKL